jgi:hypothetical protein
MLNTDKASKVDGNTNLIDELSVTGKMPESGEIYVNEDGEVALYAVYDVTCYTKTFTDNDLTETTDTKTCKNNVLLSFNDYYNAGYNKGVADADNRENTSSTNYQSGYNQGHDDGYNEGIADANSVENTSSISYQSGYNKGVDDTKQGTAIESDVLAGVTFTSENGVNLTGSMANNGELNWKPTTSTTYTLQAGYYSGGTLDSSSVYTTGYNDGINVAKQGTATASQVLTGYTFTNSSNVNISGTMANKGALTWKPTSSTSATYDAGYYSSITLDSSGAYNAGVTAADARTNTNSANYKSGYNAGVTAADARTNTSSANYQAGYNAGKSSVLQTRSFTNEIAIHRDFASYVMPLYFVPCYGYSSIKFVIRSKDVSGGRYALNISDKIQSGDIWNGGSWTYTYALNKTTEKIWVRVLAADISASGDETYAYIYVDITLIP